MLKFVKYVVAIAVVLFILVSVLSRLPAVQDRLMFRIIENLGSSVPDLRDDSLSAVVCGSRSPLPSPGRAQSCAGGSPAPHKDVRWVRAHSRTREAACGQRRSWQRMRVPSTGRTQDPP